MDDLTMYAKDVRFGQLNPQIFSLSVIQTQMQFDFQPQFAEKNLDFSIEYTPENSVDLQVYGDYYRISQVCNNLVQNAVKFTPAGGRIVMRIKAHGKLEGPKHLNDKSSPCRSSSIS